MTTSRILPTAVHRVLLVTLLVCIGSTTALAQDGDPTKTPTASDLFSNGEVSDIWLRINAKDWSDLRAGFMENTYYPADLEWRGVVVRNVGIRVRGRASRSATKPGLLIDFNRYVSGQNFLGLKSLVLDNNWQDPSMMHERLSMLVFERMGIAVPREAYVRLYIGADREYLGVYSVVEAIDKAFLLRTLQENDGHLYEYKNVDPYHFEDRDQDLRWFADRFEPRTHESESTWSLYSPIKDLVRAVNVSAQDRMLDELPEYLDLRHVATILAVQNVLSQKDGLVGVFGMANFYLYRYQAKRLSQFIPWDQDLAFDDLNLGPTDRLDTNVLSARIWDTPRLRDLYLEAMRQTERVIDQPAECETPEGVQRCTWLERQVNVAYAQIRDAVYTDPTAPYTLETFEQAVDTLRAFGNQRAVVLGRFMEQVAPTAVSK